MRCISLWQPWASLVVHGIKSLETRGWATDYRGPLGIHAARRAIPKHVLAHPDILDALLRAGLTSPQSLPKGALVGTVEVVACLPTEEVITKIGRQEYSLGNYSARRFAWVLAYAKPLRRPIPLTGRQRFFRYDGPLELS